MSNGLMKSETMMKLTVMMEALIMQVKVNKDVVYMDDRLAVVVEDMREVSCDGL